MYRKQKLAFLSLGAFVAGLLLIDFRILTSSEVVAPRIEKLLQDRLGGAVEVGRVNLSDLGVLRCFDLRIRPPADVAPDDEIACDYLEVAYRGVPLVGSLAPTRVLARGLKADVGRDALRYWIRRLAPEVPEAPDASAAASIPVVLVEGARITTDLPEVFVPGERLDLRDLRLTVHPLDGGNAWGEFQVDGGALGAWSGRLLYDDARASVRADLDCPVLGLGGSLARRMRPDIFLAWERYALEGPAGIQGRLEFDLGKEAPGLLKDWAFRVRCLGSLSGRYRNFPYRVRDLEGEFELLPRSIRIRGIRGRSADGGAVFLDGRSAGYGAESAVDIDIRLERFRLDDEVREAAPPDLRRLWGDLNPSGRVDAHCRVARGQGPDLPTRLDVTVHAADGAVRHAAFPYPIDRIRGEVHYTDEGVELRHLEGAHGDARVRIEGRLGSIAEGAGLALEIQGDNVRLDAVLRDAVPDAVKNIWSLLRPSGHVDVKWTLTQPEGRDARTRHRVEVHGREAAITCRDLPIPVTGIRGGVEYDGEALVLRHLEGVCRDAALTADGTVRWDGAATDVRLEVGTERLPVDGPLLEVLPERVRGVAEKVGLTGRVNARVRAAWRSEPARPARGHYTAEVRLEDGALQSHLPLTGLRGRVNLEGEFRPQGHTMAGVLKLSEASVAEKRLTDVGAVFQIAEDRVTFHDVRGTAYDGVLHAPFVAIDAAQGRYEGSGRIDGMDLVLFARDTFVAGRPVAGRLSGHLEFGGEAGNVETLRGRGKVEIQDGNLWEVPFFLQLVRILNLGAFPSREAFRSGHVRFAIADALVRIDSFLFSSDSVTVSGRGRIKFDGKLDLLIDTKFSSTILAEIPGVRQIIEVLKRNVVAVEARGTFREPKMRLKAFPLKDILSAPEDPAPSPPGM